MATPQNGARDRRAEQRADQHAQPTDQAPPTPESDARHRDRLARSFGPASRRRHTRCAVPKLEDDAAGNARPTNSHHSGRGEGHQQNASRARVNVHDDSRNRLAASEPDPAKRAGDPAKNRWSHLPRRYGRKRSVVDPDAPIAVSPPRNATTSAGRLSGTIGAPSASVSGRTVK